MKKDELSSDFIKIIDYDPGDALLSRDLRDNIDHDNSEYVSPEYRLFNLAGAVKAFVDDEYQFVFLWGMPNAGKTHILFTLYLLFGEIGTVSIEDKNEVQPSGPELQRFLKEVDDFRNCMPAPGTSLHNNYYIPLVINFNKEIFGDIPKLKLVLIEAAGEMTIPYHSKERFETFDLPMLQNIILNDPIAKIASIFVAPFNDTNWKDNGQKLESIFDVLYKKRKNILKDDFLLIFSKWDMEPDGGLTDPLVRLEEKYPQVLTEFSKICSLKSICCYQTYITGTWESVNDYSGVRVQYVPRVELESAKCLAHWLYRCATGHILYPEKEPQQEIKTIFRKIFF